MHISIIVAMAHHRVIGLKNQMPWHLPADLKHFKTVTMGKPMIMGRKTFESIGRPLPGRLNIVITRNTDWHVDGVVIAHSLTDALAAAGTADEVMIIGGGHLYAEALPAATRLYLTQIDLDVREADTWFPEYSPEQWHLVHEDLHQTDDKNPYSYRFQILERSA
jgi:dihydrofolate reductase